MQGIGIAIRLWLLALCAAISLTVACGDRHVEQASRTGRVQFALSGTSANGVQYRLRQGTFGITGASINSVSTEDYLQTASITVELQVGDYEISLNPGWYLEAASEDGGYAPVEAILTSTNPQSFTIEYQKTSSVSFRFRVGGETFELGNGGLTIHIDVDNTNTSAAGASGVGGVGGSGGQTTGGSEQGGAAGQGGTISSGGTGGICSANTAIALVAGYNHSCALLSGGSVQCWGVNSSGQLGNGTTTDSGIPVAVSGITNALAIAAGDIHACAVLSTGSVQCWGNNGFGQLGNGSRTNSAIPVTVPGIADAVAVGAGVVHTCTLLRGGSVQCWGDRSQGQFGDGAVPLSPYTLPVTVSGVTGAIALAVGSYHACALISGGSVQCWGGDFLGQLGDGTATYGVTVPVTVPGITNAVAISADDSRTCAVLSGGVVQCWGANGGNGTTTNIPDAITVVAGAAHSCVLLSGGSVQCWGRNSHGELGDGTLTDSLAHVTVVGFGCAGTGGTTGSGGAATGSGGAATGGAPSTECNTGYGDCDGNPGNGCETDLRTNRNHCGSCKSACPPDYSNDNPYRSINVCSDGRCVCGGVSPRLCMGFCVDTYSSWGFCGSCWGGQCNAGESCVAGRCVAPF